MKSLGGLISAEDLARYRARVTEPTAIAYRDCSLSLAPRLTAGPSMARTIEALSAHRFAGSQPDADAFLAELEDLDRNEKIG